MDEKVSKPRNQDMPVQIFHFNRTKNYVSLISQQTLPDLHKIPSFLIGFTIVEMTR